MKLLCAGKRTVCNVQVVSVFSEPRFLEEKTVAFKSAVRNLFRSSNFDGTAVAIGSDDVLQIES
jgi:hypothetical protein